MKNRVLLDVRVGVSLGEDVRVFLPEDVTDPAAGEDLQTAATLPHPERDLCTRKQKENETTRETTSVRAERNAGDKVKRLVAPVNASYKNDVKVSKSFSMQ